MRWAPIPQRMLQGPAPILPKVLWTRACGGGVRAPTREGLLAEFEEKLQTAWAPTRVFDYIADFRNLADWHPAVSSAKLATLDPMMRNARFTLRATMAGRPVAAELTTVELDRPRLIVAIASNRAATTTDRFTIEAPGDRLTVVTYSSTMKLRASLRVIGPFMVGGLRESWRQAAAGLADAIEAIDRAPAT